MTSAVARPRQATEGRATGGPAGGCIRPKWLDLGVDFDTLAKAGSINGQRRHDNPGRKTTAWSTSAKFFMAFSQDE